VWPFDTVTLRWFVLTLTVPLAPLLIELAVDVGGSVAARRPVGVG